MVLFGLSIQSNATENTQLTWYTNLDSVVTISNETNKPIFGFFTGSDWCGWCIKLQQNVFAKQAFIDWAAKSVILLELDFPRRKVLPDELRNQNASLQQAFNVTGYPTIWIFTAQRDETNKKINLSAWGKLGYPSGATPGKEEEKFLQDAAVVMSKDPAKQSN